jgi:hypothetical protein
MARASWRLNFLAKVVIQNDRGWLFPPRVFIRRARVMDVPGYGETASFTGLSGRIPAPYTV